MGGVGLGAGRQEEGRAEKISGPLGGDVLGYRKYRRRQGGRTDANTFRDLQYPKRSERRVGIGVERDESGECGCWGLPRDQIDRGNFHAVIGRI